MFCVLPQPCKSEKKEQQEKYHQQHDVCITLDVSLPFIIVLYARYGILQPIIAIFGLCIDLAQFAKLRIHYSIYMF